MSCNDFQELVDIMRKLRGKDGCPWDREQSHQSLRPYLLEETYEVLEAIDNNDPGHLKEELGDLLLQVVFHGQIAEDNNAFTVNDVIKGISEKLIRRHPHVFGNTVIRTADEQTVHWEKIKKKEGKKSAIDGVPRELPALTRSRRVQEKAASAGFDWTETGDVYGKVKEELGELEEALESGSSDAVFDEFGDLLFALVNLSRFIHIDPEASLRQAIEKFSARFKKVEETIKKNGLDMHSLNLKELDEVWETVKKDMSRT